MLAIPSKELGPEEIEFLEAMKRLQGNSAFMKLVDAVEEEVERYKRNLSHSLAISGGPHAEPVNQRYIDYQRGFWSGAIYAVTKFPKQKAKGWDKFVAETKESETA